MSTTDTRAAFEASVKKKFPLANLSRNTEVGNYRSCVIEDMWWAYQAATEAAKATGTAGEPELPLPKCLGDDVCGLQTFGYTADQMREYGQACAEAAWLVGGQHQHEVEKAARQPAPVALSDDQINDLWNALPGIEIHNKAYAQGMATDYALRIAFAKAIIAATNRSQP